MVFKDLHTSEKVRGVSFRKQMIIGIVEPHETCESRILLEELIKQASLQLIKLLVRIQTGRPRSNKNHIVVKF